jgi:cold shock CspA family protein
VEFFNNVKGYGFIKENDTNEKFFVHVSSLTEEIAENDKVSFELEQGLKGLNAVRVKRI